MKIILSRKGFDSGYGGYPSPVLPDGRLVSLPIPYDREQISYGDLFVDRDTSYFHLMHMLKPSIVTGGEKRTLTSNTPCHLDPDIRASTLKRKMGWKGLFGQIDAAQTHLDNQGVGPGDVFLFFGWFRNTVTVDGRQIFDPGDPQGRHIIFGYLQVGEVWRVTRHASLPEWAQYHPHASQRRRERKNNTLYAARDYLDWSTAMPGFGMFPFAPDLVLTAPNTTRSRWNLPDFFRKTPISYHSSSSWKDGYFLSAAKGQEFVIDADKRGMEWAKDLVERHGGIH
jgi:hypothetical protein